MHTDLHCKKSDTIQLKTIITILDFDIVLIVFKYSETKTFVKNLDTSALCKL